MTTKYFYLATTGLACCLLCPSAYSEHLDPDANWNRLIYHTDCAKRLPGSTNFRVRTDADQQLALDNWFDSYKNLILKNSTITEDLERNSVAYSFALTRAGEPKDLKLEESGGTEIDNKVKALIEMCLPTQLAPPPTQLPFVRRILVKFSHGSLWIGMQQQYQPKKLP